MRRERFSPECSGEASQRLFGASRKEGACPSRQRSPKTSATALRTGPPPPLQHRRPMDRVGPSRDYATAERLGIEFGEDFRLLADIGWAADEDRRSLS